MSPILLESVSIGLIILSFILLVTVLIKHFKGMEYPPYWIYFIGGFILLSLNSVFANIAPQTEMASSVNIMLKLLANFSIFLGSFEVYRRYESSIAANLAQKPKSTRKKKR